MSPPNVTQLKAMRQARQTEDAHDAVDICGHQVGSDGWVDEECRARTWGGRRRRDDHPHRVDQLLVRAIQRGTQAEQPPHKRT